MSYLTRGSQPRIARRRLLQVSAAASASSAILLACGSSGSNSGGDKSNLVTKAVDTTKIAKRGGVYKYYAITDVARGFDPHLRDNSLWSHPALSYETLLQVKPTVLEPTKSDVFSGLAAESWEFSPDKLSLIFKMRGEAHLDPRPPTRGRLLEASDVEFTWQKFAGTATLRAEFANAIAPDAPVLSVSAPDARTAVFKLAFPAPDVLGALATPSNGYFFIVPKEADGGFDTRRELRGSGPWYQSEYQPSVRFSYVRNPGHWSKQENWVDNWEMPIVSEYVQRLAQFRVGNIYAIDIRPEDIVATKKAVPDLQMVQTIPLGLTTRPIWGWREGQKSPFRDERVRQAYSMALDRDLFIDTFGSVSAYRAQGLPVDVVWNSPALRLDYNEWCLDPRSKDFGPNAKYLQHNIAEAKKLLSAAGFPNGLDVDAAYIKTSEYGEDFPRRVEVALGMVAEAGIRSKITAIDYTTEFRPKYVDARGDFDGVAYRRASTGTPRSEFFAVYHSKGSQFNGFSASGTSNFGGDPEYDALTSKMQREFDSKTAISLGNELQRLEAKRQYTPYFPGGASGFDLAWPVVGNFGVYQGETRRVWWIDETKAPVKRA